MPSDDPSQAVPKLLQAVQHANSLFQSVNGQEVKLDPKRVFQRTKLYPEQVDAEMARDNPEAEAYVDQVVKQWRDRLISTLGKGVRAKGG